MSVRWSKLSSRKVWFAVIALASLVLMGVEIAGSGTVEVVDTKDCIDVPCSTAGTGLSVLTVSRASRDAGQVCDAGGVDVGTSAVSCGPAPVLLQGARYRMLADDKVTLGPAAAAHGAKLAADSPEMLTLSAEGGLGVVCEDYDAGASCQADAACVYNHCYTTITCQADAGCVPSGCTSVYHCQADAGCVPSGCTSVYHCQADAGCVPSGCTTVYSCEAGDAGCVATDDAGCGTTCQTDAGCTVERDAGCGTTCRTDAGCTVERDAGCGTTCRADVGCIGLADSGCESHCGTTCTANPIVDPTIACKSSSGTPNLNVCRVRAAPGR